MSVQVNFNNLEHWRKRIETIRQKRQNVSLLFMLSRHKPPQENPKMQEDPEKKQTKTMAQTLKL